MVPFTPKLFPKGKTSKITLQREYTLSLLLELCWMYTCIYVVLRSYTGLGINGDCPFYGYPNTHVHHQPLSRRTTEPESFEPIPLSCAWCDFTRGDIDGVSCIPAVSHPFLVGYDERGWRSRSDATGCLVFLNVFFMNNWHAKLRQFMRQVPRHRMEFCEWAWPTCSKQTLRQMLHFIILHLYSWVHGSTENIHLQFFRSFPSRILACSAISSSSIS